MDWKRGDADAARQGKRMCVESGELRKHGERGDTVAEAFGGTERPIDSGIRENQRKLFSTVARGEIARPGCAPSRRLLAIQ